MPLRRAGPRLAPRAGVLLDAAPRMLPLIPRYLSPCRPRSPPPRYLRVAPEARFEETSPLLRETPIRRRPLNYRQGSAGVEPRVPPSPVRMRRSPPPPPDSPTDSAPRPQFALPDDESPPVSSVPEYCSASTYEALAKSSPRVSATNLAASVIGDKTYDKALARKVLNTERYNNGARAVQRRGSRVSRVSRVSRASRGSSAGRRGGSLRRATIRAMLAFSGLFYALSFVAFYFLSLP